MRISGYEADPVLTDMPSPEIGAHEVLVRVRAASINPLDVKLLSGQMQALFPLNFPYTMGTDLAGTVERTGTLAVRWLPGDKVVGRADPTRGGALGEFAILPATSLASVSGGVTFEKAAAVPTAAGTAWQALFEIAKLTAGETVLVHGGAGCVGSFAIQLGRIVGARVIATASGSGVELAHDLGADQVIDYRRESFAEKLSDIDVVLDTVGGMTQQASFGVLRAGGMLVSVAEPPDEALAKVHHVKSAYVFHQTDGSRLGVVLGLLEAGSLRVVVDREVLLVKAASAFERLRSGRARGKIIVSIQGAHRPPLC